MREIAESSQRADLLPAIEIELRAPHREAAVAIRALSLGRTGDRQSPFALATGSPSATPKLP